MGQRTKIIKSQETSSTTRRVALIREKVENESAPQPQIRIHKSGEDIDAMEVTCTCGKSVLIECHYDGDLARRDGEGS